MGYRAAPAGEPLPRLGGKVVRVPVEGGVCVAEIAGEGRSLLFLHGWTLDRRMWQPQFAALRGRYRPIAIDRRGFGQSSAPPDRDAEVDDMEAVVAALGLERFVLVGMSQAGSTAIHYALRHPERVAGLVLQGISLAGVADRSNASDRIPVHDYMGLAQAGRLEEMKAAWRRHPLMRSTNPEAQPLINAMLADYAGRDLLAAPAAPSAALTDVRQLMMPVLALTGEQDTAWRRDVTAAIGRTAPHGSARFLPGGGHLCNVCDAATYNVLLEGFVAHALDAASKETR